MNKIIALFLAALVACAPSSGPRRGNLGGQIGGGFLPPTRINQGGGGVGDITAVNVTGPITGGGTSGAVNVGLGVCSADEIYKMNGGGTAWACDSDDTGGGGGGPISDFVLADVTSHSNLAAGVHHDVTPTDWATNTRHYLGGDASAGSTITGFDDLPVGTIRFIELGDRNSKGPLTLLSYEDSTSTGSLGANRIVTPDNAPLRVDPGGMFAMVYIGGGPLHGWRVLWSTSTANPRIGLKHFRFYDKVSATLASGTTNDWAPTGGLEATRWRVTVATTGSTLTGITHNSSSTPGIGDGEVRIIENVGDGSGTATATLTLAHVGSGSTGDNSFWNPNAANVVLPPNGSAVFVRDSTLDAWRMIASTDTANTNRGPALTPSALASGDTNDWNPTGFANHTRIRVTPNAAGSTLTGMAAGRDGEIKILEVLYAPGGDLTLAEYRTSSGVNRFVLPDLVDLVIPPGGSAIMVYDKTLEIWKAAGVAGTAGGAGISDGDKGDITVSGSGSSWAIDTAVVTLAKMANLSQSTIIGRAVGAGTGVPTALTSTQATAILDTFASGTKGLAPSSGGGATNYLRADGTWAAPPGTGDITDVVAGAGLVTGGSSGSVTVDVGAGSGITVSANDVAIDPTYTQRRVSGTCSAGSSIRVIAQDGTVTCETDDGGGITNGAGNNVVMKSDGTNAVASTITDTSTITTIDKGTSGAVASISGTGLEVEGAAASANYITLRTPDAQNGGILFNTAAGDARGYLLYNESLGRLAFAAQNLQVLQMTGSLIKSLTAVDFDSTLNVDGATTVHDFRGTVISPSITGVHTAYAPTGIATATMIDLQPTGSVDLVGLTTGALGRIITIRNANNIGYNVTIYDEGGTAAAGDRFDLGGDTHWTLKAGDSMSFEYTAANRWASISHVGRQLPGLWLTGDLAMGGASITGALNYTGSGTLTVGGSSTLGDGLSDLTAVVGSFGVGTPGLGTATLIADANTTTTALYGRVRSGGGAPTISSCGTSPSAVGGQFGFLISVGSGSATSCTATFPTSYTAEPSCVATGGGAYSVYISSKSATALTITSLATANMASTKLNVICVGQI